MEKTYKVVKVYNDPELKPQVIHRGLTIEQAREICSRPTTHYTSKKDPSKNWMYVFYVE